MRTQPQMCIDAHAQEDVYLVCCDHEKAVERHVEHACRHALEQASCAFFAPQLLEHSQPPALIASSTINLRQGRWGLCVGEETQRARERTLTARNTLLIPLHPPPLLPSVSPVQSTQSNLKPCSNNIERVGRHGCDGPRSSATDSLHDDGVISLAHSSFRTWSVVQG